MHKMNVFETTELCSWASRVAQTGFSPWVRKILWRRNWPPTPVFLPGEFHGQRKNLAGPSLWGRKESDKTEQLTHKCISTLYMCILPHMQIILIIKRKRLLLSAQRCRELNKPLKFTLKKSWTAFLKPTNHPGSRETWAPVERHTVSWITWRQAAVTSKKSIPPGVANGWRLNGHWQDSAVPEAANTVGESTPSFSMGPMGPS